MTFLTRLMIAPALAAAFVFAGDTSQAEAHGFGLSVGGGRGLNINSFGGSPFRYGGVSPFYGSAFRGYGGFNSFGVVPVNRGFNSFHRYGAFRPSYGYNAFRSYRAPVVVPAYRGGRFCY